MVGIVFSYRIVLILKVIFKFDMCFVVFFDCSYEVFGFEVIECIYCLV